MIKRLVLLFVFILFSVQSGYSSVSKALDMVANGMMVQKYRMDLIAENVANANTIKGKDGKGYRRKYPVIVTTDQGPRATGYVEDTRPLVPVYDPGNPLADSKGFVYYSNVSIEDSMVDLSYTNVLHKAMETAYNNVKATVQQSLELVK